MGFSQYKLKNIIIKITVLFSKIMLNEWWWKKGEINIIHFEVAWFQELYIPYRVLPKHSIHLKVLKTNIQHFRIHFLGLHSICIWSPLWVMSYYKRRSNNGAINRCLNQPSKHDSLSSSQLSLSVEQSVILWDENNGKLLRK